MVKIFQRNFGIALIILLAIIPIILWFPYSSFSNTGLTFLSIGQALALSGAVLLSINFILSGRFKFLEPFFGGLNQIYIVHHIVGAVAFIFLIYHPTFIALSYFKLAGISAAIDFLINFSDLPVLFGKIALTVIFSVLFTTFFLRSRLAYQIWKFIHKFMGLGLLLATLHIATIPSTVSVNPVLQLYLLFFIFLGFSSYAYRVLLYKYLVRRYPFKVISATPINSQVTEVVLSPLKTAISYFPGQFIFIKFKSPGITGEVHPFSLTSALNGGNLSLAIKASGDFTQNIKRLKKGTTAEIEGPFGYFTFSRYENKRQIWVAGGIGITPFLGMARSLKAETSYKIDLYYQVGVPEEAVYLNELQHISKKIPDFKVIPHYSRTQKRLSAETVSKTSIDFMSADIFLCGPPPMMASLRGQFRKFGVKNFHIHSEEFALN